MKPRLILFTSAYPYGTGEDFLDSELPIIAQHFQSITIQPMTNGLKGTRRLTPKNVDVRLPILPKSRLLKLSVAIRDLFRYPDLRQEFFQYRVYTSRVRFYNYLLAVAIKSYWNRSQFDVAGAVLYFYWGVGAAYLATGLQTQAAKIVVRLHGGDIYEELSDGYFPLRRDIFECSDWICPVSNYGKSYLLGKYPQFITKIDVSRLGTQDLGPSLFEPNQKIMVLVSCGNLIPLKRIDHLAEYLGSQTKNITWHHFGDGPEMARIKSIIAQHPKNIKAVLHGRQPNAVILNFYKNNHIDAFVSVSESEGVPVSIMEAMSFGIPVVATDVGGTVEILYKKGAVILPKNFCSNDLSKALDVVCYSFCTQDVRNKIKDHWSEVASAATNFKLFAEKILISS